MFQLNVLIDAVKITRSKVTEKEMSCGSNLLTISNSPAKNDGSNFDLSVGLKSKVSCFNRNVYAFHIKSIS